MLREEGLDAEAVRDRDRRRPGRDEAGRLAPADPGGRPRDRYTALVHRVLARLPPSVVRAVGRLQFRVPALRRVALRLNSRLTEVEGSIAHGVGAGLRFDATGGQPGCCVKLRLPARRESDTSQREASAG
jgi:hypothetical protein